jgi:hypothetical protein
MFARLMTRFSSWSQVLRLRQLTVKRPGGAMSIRPAFRFGLR